MAFVNFKQSTEAKILAAPMADGTFYVSTDTNKLFLDSGSKRIEVSANTNTTYTLTKDGNTITLKGSDGQTYNVTDANTTYANATTSASGLMSAADKAKLDKIAAEANKIVVDSSLSSTSTNPVQNKVIKAALDGKANAVHNHDTANIVSGTLSADRLPVIPVAKGGTGKTNGKDAANFLINSLAGGTTAAPSDQHTILTEDIDPQHKGEYVRRPLSALWAYIKQKCDSIYLGRGEDARRAIGLKDMGDGRTITVNYAADALKNAPWFGVWENAVLKTMAAKDVPNAIGALPTSGGTVAGLLRTQGGTIVHSANGESGKGGYVNIAEITLSKSYLNAPIVFEIFRRGMNSPNKLYIRFQNTDSHDPTLESFKYDGFDKTSTKFYMYKSSTSIWQLYILKTEPFDYIGIGEYKTNFNGMDGFEVKFKNQLASTVPEGAIEATYIGLPMPTTANNGKFLGIVDGAPTWTTGVSGPKGDKGETGAAGPIGPAGPQGVAGPKGEQGLRGPAGETGARGPAGPTGPQGPVGNTGATPVITATATVGSATGTPSVTVTKGGTATNPSFAFAFNNLKGATGATGATGPKGDAGANGSPGERGPQGIQGPQGPKGEKGEIGPKGATGDRGPQGPAGVGLPEIAIQSTQPTDSNIKIWIKI